MKSVSNQIYEQVNHDVRVRDRVSIRVKNQVLVQVSGHVWNQVRQINEQVCEQLKQNRLI
jgi:hypothetical protein